MQRPDRRTVVSVPAGVPFLDLLASHLITTAAGDPMALGRTVVLVPNRRSASALRSALVRQVAPALLLPQIVPLADLGDAAWFDSDAPGPPPIDPGHAVLLLAGVIAGTGVRPSRALSEASGLLEALGELEAWETNTGALAKVELEHELAAHWSKTLRRLEAVLLAWPQVIADLGRCEPTIARVRATRAIARKWSHDPEASGHIVAAGFVQAPPFVCDLLGTVSRLPGGLVVLPGLDLSLAEAEWQDIDPAGPHPQAPLKALLAAMGVARDDVGAMGAPEASPWIARVIAGRVDGGGEVPGLACAEASGPEQEAAAIALALREAVETGRTCALVTPDRELARRVGARLARWQIAADDSAGAPLAALPAGAFARLALRAGRRDATPHDLIALLEHPLAGNPGERLAWLDAVRALEGAARGPPQPHDRPSLNQRLDERFHAWWHDVQEGLSHLDALIVARPDRWAEALASTVDAVSGGRCWDGEDGRSLSHTLERLGEHGAALPDVDCREAGRLIEVMLGAETVRPPPAMGHPLVSIWGPLEARLQSAELIVIGGLNEGVWPGDPAPDPWLPPFVRTALGLPGEARRVALAAHDLGQWLSTPGQVLLTRSRRDALAPTVPSRVWLRLQAAGLLRPHSRLLGWAEALDGAAHRPLPMPRPAPNPEPALRPTAISATQLDVLRADPFAIFARRVLGLRRLPDLGELPGPRELGIALHGSLSAWLVAGEPMGNLDAMLQRDVSHALALDPVLTGLWRPRLARMAQWVERAVAQRRRDGWRFVSSETEARSALVDPIQLTGRADWIEAGPEGAEIIDFKTGSIPRARPLRAGFASQLGLLGYLARTEARTAALPVVELSYWKLSGGREAGTMKSVLSTRAEGGGRQWADASAFIDFCIDEARDTVRRYLLDGAPFVAKARPEFARMGDEFDHLARVDEWLAELYGESNAATA